MGADTLDQIREHLEAIRNLMSDDWNSQRRYSVYKHAAEALAKFDALIAEGRIEDYDDYHALALVTPLLVGVGCGNAKKDTA